MTTEELIDALRPFSDGTLAAVRFKSDSDSYFEMPVKAVEYVPMADGRDAYVVLTLHQGAKP